LWTDSIDVTFGTSAIFGATVPTFSNGVLRTYVYHGPSGSTPGHRVTVPLSINLQSENFSNLSPLVAKPGIWTHAALFREASNDAGGITNVQVSALTTFIDGEPVLDNMRASDVASVFNGAMAVGSGLQVESQTVPLGGEVINSMPGAAAAAGQGVLVDLLPLFVPPENYYLSQLPEAKSAFTALMAGTLGAYSIVYRIVEHKSDSSIARASARLGVQSGRGFAKVAAHPAEGRLGKYLPVDVTGSSK
jgi:hypothetical protein